MIERTDRVNWSTLKHILQSPKHYRYALDHPREDTEALLLGRVTHCAVYEPDELDQRYAVQPRFHRGQNDDTAIKNGYEGGKQVAAEWDQAHVGVEIVTADLFARATGMRDALLSDPIAAPMVLGGYAEQLVTWTDADTGIDCRGRIDHINGCLSDLKTTRNVEPRAFARDAARLLYHAQIAYYADGLAANGVVLIESPALIVVESSPPHDVLVLEVGDEALQAGRRVYRAALDTLARCRHEDRWPGVADGARQRITLPAWAMPEPEEEEITMGGVGIF